jgi:hypothetical protein
MNKQSIDTGQVPLTKRAQDAWIKRAVKNGMPETDARDLVEKMAAIKVEKPSRTRAAKSSMANVSANTNPAAPGDFFTDQSLPISNASTALPISPKKAESTAVAVEISQLPLWPDVMRSLPNELLRSALFNARNKNQPRVNMKSEPIAVIGDGRISYQGEELRQDDETVFLQLVHLARQHLVGQLVEFTAYSFCKSINWPINKQSYERLKECFKRMQASGLDVYSKRLGRGVSLSMIPVFEYKDAETEKSLPRWRIRIAPELVELFGNNYFTRIEWAQRLQLSVGLATWLHGYLATHRVPYPIKIETIAKGAGLKQETTKSELRRLIKKALANLVECGFLIDFEISNDVVAVKRAEHKV